MDATTQDLLTVVGGAIAVLVAIAIGAWMFSKLAATRLAPIALLLLAFCIEVFFHNKQPYAQVGLQIYPNDLIALLLLLAAVVGFATRPLPLHDSPFLLWLAFGLTIIASLVVGLNDYGRFAGTEARPFFYIWVAGLYCAANNFSEADFKRIARWCTATAYAVIGIALYYWIAIEAGFANRQEIFDEPDTWVLRPVGAHAALFVGAVGVMHTMAWLRGSGSRFSGLQAAAFLAFVVVLQHRSVWIGTMVALLSVFLLERRHLPRRFGLLLGFALSACLAIAVAGAFGALDELTRRLQGSAQSMTDSDGTFAARVDGWLRLLDGWLDAPAQTLLFGYPFGAGYSRGHFGMTVDWDPHNFYLQLVFRVGLVGAFLVLLPTVWAIVHGLRVKCVSESEYLWTRGLAIVLLMSMVYWIAYSSNYLVGAATGMAIAEMIRRHKRQPSHLPRLAETRESVMAPTALWRADR